MRPKYSSFLFKFFRFAIYNIDFWFKISKICPKILHFSQISHSRRSTGEQHYQIQDYSSNGCQRICHMEDLPQKIRHKEDSPHNECDREFERKRLTNICNSVDVEDLPHNGDGLGSGGLGLGGLRSGSWVGPGGRRVGVGGSGFPTPRPQLPRPKPPGPTPWPNPPTQPLDFNPPYPNPPNPTPLPPQPITIVW